MTTTARRIFITGATGGLGRRLVVDRLARGDSMVVLSRRPDEARRLFAAVANPRIEVVEGDPGVPGRWQRLVGACDAVVHLAGEPIAARRWNAEVRETIRRSRVEGTYQLAFAVRTAAKPPAVLISASGIGILPRGRAGPLDETAPPGREFLARVALAWEREAMRARSASTRVVALRIPIVLDAESGFLREIAPWWRRGLDPTPWSARDRVPWIHWRDVLRVVDRALGDDRLEGPVHAVAPDSSEAIAWRQAMVAAVCRGAVRIPVIASRLAAGAVIDAMRGSCDARPAKLEAIGFEWKQPDLASAIAQELRPRNEPAQTSVSRVVLPPAPIAAPRPRSTGSEQAPDSAPSSGTDGLGRPATTPQTPAIAEAPAAAVPGGLPSSRPAPRPETSGPPVESGPAADVDPARSSPPPTVRT
ncbi:MAG: NAD-dependent epimerase/dehydratase family protein, partial [Phycisphaerales bacterium]